MKESLFTLARRSWPELIAAAAPLIAFAPIVFGGQVLYWGLPSLQFVPWRVLVNEAFRAGRLPLWTPLLGMGAPVLANYQSAALYPPNWLALLLPPESAVSILAVLHLSWAGLGMARLARQAGLGDFGAAVAGLAFGLSGYLTGRLWFITINNTMAWLPWILLHAAAPSDVLHPLLNLRGLTRRVLTLTVLLAFQLLAGHAQSVFYTLLIAAAWIGWRTFATGGGSNKWKTFLISGSAFGAALALAAGVCALQLLPTYELLRLSPRAEAAAYDFAMTYSLWPWRLLTFAMPNLFGHPADGNYWGYATYWEDNAYLGLLPLAFAAHGLWWGGRHIVRRTPAGRIEPHTPQPALAAFCLGLAVISIVLSLGANTPVFPWLYRNIPGFGLFQAPARMLIGYTFALSLLAGLGAHHWLASERKRYVARLGLAGALAMAALGLAGQSMGQGRVITMAGGMASAAITAALIFALVLAQGRAPARLWQGAALLLMGADLGLAAVRLNPLTSRDLYTMQPAFVQTGGRLFQTRGDEYNARFNFLFRLQSFGRLDPARLRNSLLANLPALDGIATVNNFDPLVTERYADFIALMEGQPSLMRLADVTAVVNSTGVITELPAGSNRVRIVYEAQTVNSREAAAAALLAPGFDPDSTVILEPTEPPPFPPLPLGPRPLTLTVTLERAGYVVVSDLYYPGWRAQVDGSPAPLFIANLAFRAVAAPAGAHTVTLEYAPASVTAGLFVSALSGLALFGLILFARSPAPRPSP